MNYNIYYNHFHPDGDVIFYMALCEICVVMWHYVKNMLAHVKKDYLYAEIPYKKNKAALYVEKKKTL